MLRQRWSQEKKDFFYSLAREGLSRPEIAKRMGMSHKAINKAFLRHPDLALEVRDLKLKALIDAGLSKGQIAQSLGISRNALSGRLSRRSWQGKVPNIRRFWTKSRLRTLRKMIKRGWTMQRVADACSAAWGVTVSRNSVASIAYRESISFHRKAPKKHTERVSSSKATITLPTMKEPPAWLIELRRLEALSELEEAA